MDGRVAPFPPWQRVPIQGFVVRSDLVVHAQQRKYREQEGPWIVPAEPEMGTAAHVMRPVVEQCPPNLHRTFARAALNDEALLRLANRWGLLGQGMLLAVPGDSNGDVITGESTQYWRDTICWLKVLIKLWDQVCLGNGEALRPFVKWTYRPRRAITVLIVSVDGKLMDPMGRAFKKAHGRYSEAMERALSLRNGEDVGEHGLALEREVIAIIRAAAEQPHEHGVLPVIRQVGLAEAEAQSAKWADGETIEPMRHFVHLEVNDRLRGQVDPQTWPHSRDGFTLAPVSLLARLYTLFALELSRESHTLTRCMRPDCGKEFRPIRRSAKYCSAACRSLMHYRNPPSKIA